MRKFEKLINDSLIHDKRSDVFLYPFLGNFLYYDVKIDPKETSFLIEAKQVIKLRLLLQPSVNRNFNQHLLNAACCIHFADGSKVIRTVCQDKVNKLRNYFKRYGQNGIQTFIRMQSKPLPWKTDSMQHHYSRQSVDPFLYYTALHDNIIKNIEALMSEHHFEGLNIIDAGCGDGQLLKKMEVRLGSKLTKGCNFLGFDFNAQNIQDCWHEYQGTCVFRQGDMLEIQRIIQEAFLSKSLNPDWPIILTLSGTLTRLVLDDGFKASQVLMQASAMSVRYLIGGGVGEPLITPGMIKRIGYKVLPLGSETSTHNFFCCQLIAKEEFFAKKLVKLRETNRLDLSLCPEVSALLRGADAFLQDNSSIDLSFVPVTEDLIKALGQITQKHLNLSLTFWHYDKDQMIKFLQSFFLRAKVSIRILTQDGVLLSSSRFFNRLQNNPDYPPPYEDSLINDFILDHVVKKISTKEQRRPDWLKQQEELLKEIADLMPLTLDRDDDNRPIVILPTGKQNAFKKFLDAKISDLRSAIAAGNLTQLDGLVALYRYGLSVKTPGKFFYETEQIGNIEDEIQLYYQLANAHSKVFPHQAMKMLAYWAVSRKTEPLSSKRKEAMAFVEQLFTNEEADNLQTMAMGSQEH